MKDRSRKSGDRPWKTRVVYSGFAGGFECNRNNSSFWGWYFAFTIEFSCLTCGFALRACPGVFVTPERSQDRHDLQN